MDLFNWIELLIGPLCGAIGWLAGTRSRRNRAIAELQSTINLLADRNNDLYEEVQKLRSENLELKAVCQSNNIEIEALKRMIEQHNPKKQPKNPE